MVLANITAQYVKKADALADSPTIKYNGSANIVTWTRITGISEVIWAMQNAAGWKNPKPLCLVRTGRPLNESVTSDIAIRLLCKREKKRAPDFMKSPAEFSGAS